MALDKILEKIAISDALKHRASVERSARISAEAAVERLDRKDPNYHPTQGRQVFNVKGPAPKSHTSAMGTYKDFQRRKEQIVAARHEGVGRSQGLEQHVRNTKIKKLVGKGAKGLLAAGSVAGVGYGAKKLYDHYKQASLVVPALENLGLGILAVPSAKTLMDTNASDHDKSHAKYELAGLGVLGADPTYELGHAAAQKLAPHANNMGLNMMKHTSPMVRRMGQGISNLAGKIRFR